MEGTARFRVNAPEVIYQEMDGEVILINLEKGFYYCLDPVGSAAWGALDANGTFDGICDEVMDRYDGAAEEIRVAMAELIETLRAEGLIVDSGESAAAQPVVREDESGRKERFTVPRLEKYDDLQNLLLLDPIHEADDTGWPRRK